MCNLTREWLAMVLYREEDGKLPTYAWPGGYPVAYLCEDGGELCAACANGENGSEARENNPDDPQWNIVGQSIHYEGPPIVCAHCGKEIASAYGDPD